MDVCHDIVVTTFRISREMYDYSCGLHEYLSDDAAKQFSRAAYAAAYAAEDAYSKAKAFIDRLEADIRLAESEMWGAWVD
jgi:hypothetical protein